MDIIVIYRSSSITYEKSWHVHVERNSSLRLLYSRHRSFCRCFHDCDSHKEIAVLIRINFSLVILFDMIWSKYLFQRGLLTPNDTMMSMNCVVVQRYIQCLHLSTMITLRVSDTGYLGGLSHAWKMSWSTCHSINWAWRSPFSFQTDSIICVWRTRRRSCPDGGVTHGQVSAQRHYDLLLSSLSVSNDSLLLENSHVTVATDSARLIDKLYMSQSVT